MAQSSTGSDRPLRQLRTVADLIETPALARIYAYTERNGPVTVGDIVEQTGIPQGTAYDYIDRLETAGLLQRVNESRPHEYNADAISLSISVDGTTTTVTPALVAAIARAEDDDDIGVYVDRHGLDGLAEALACAFERVDGTLTHRIVAQELDLSPLEAEIILQALEPIATAYSDAAG